MRLITRDADYAVRALIYMAQDPDQVTTAQELVERLKMPLAFSRRILQILSRKGILRSLKGNRGGFSLKQPAEKIRLFDIMEAFQGKLVAVRCMLGNNLCPNTRTCPLRVRVKKIEQTIFNELQDITIASLIRENRL